MARLAYPARLILMILALALLPSFHAPGEQAVRLVLPERTYAGAAPPPLTEVKFAAVTPDTALALNAAIPFAGSTGPAARPFALSGETASRDRAIDCLASAMWYEAGGDPQDQLAVGQVILNRVRHPAFPASVCGTVFQGSERRTGCQFTFTCDGSFARRPSAAAFDRARALARGMLGGMVDGRVGLATHYHTDWVHPVWSAAMDKLARVDTHLFFRWRGNWGRAPAMRQQYSASEPNIPALSFLSPAHHGGAVPGSDPASAQLAAAGAVADAGLIAGSPASTQARPSIALKLDVSLTQGAGAPAMSALDLCAARQVCKVIGTSPDGSISFVYVRDRRTGVEQTLWDCAQFPRRNEAQCLGPATRRWIDFEGNFATDGAAGA